MPRERKQRAGTMMPDSGKLLDLAEQETGSFLNLLEKAVLLESPTYGDKAASDACGRFFQQLFAGLGFRVRTFPQTECGDHFVAEYGEGDDALMLVGHYDTVFPMGSLAAMPWKVADGKAYGPGAADMKGGLVLAWHAVRLMQKLRIPLRRKIILCVNADEEAGSPTSRALMEEVARNSRYALILEPGMQDYRGVKVSRLGRAAYTVKAHGRSSHSGLAPKDGASAVTELAHQVGELAALNDYDRNVLVSPTYFAAGNRRMSMIPGEGELEVEARAATLEELARVATAIEGLQPKLAGMRLEITGGVNKQPLVFDAKNKALFATVNALAEGLGFSLTRHAVGSGSDGNYTFNAGTPTLDGLGVIGALLHNPGEHLFVDHVPYRMALLVRILAAL
ncbi:putative Carboxypeptidase G2 [uncultured delta proteobacterium]|uniref:Putative Carboxypeptidase G2 n=1 Tax=uncultured delta proteobacterium TaxID=34034 RepID=A0A212JCH8_9DELT|nr:putative Carboxypeptidase G2 [uncultured delta proteobacterium]